MVNIAWEAHGSAGYTRGFTVDCRKKYERGNEGGGQAGVMKN